MRDDNCYRNCLYRIGGGENEVEQRGRPRP